MKKVVDYPINIKIYIPETKRSFTLNLSIHTTIKEINTIISKKLGYNPFITNFNFECPREYFILKPTSTLQQNRIRQGDTLYAKITLTTTFNPKSSLDTRAPLIRTLSELSELKKYQKNIRSNIYGLIIEGICINEKCLSYAENMSFPLGTGEFTIGEILNGIKCPICPYRDFGINPSIVVKQIKLINCFFKYEGRYKDHQGFIQRISNSCFTKIEGENTTKLYKIIEGKQWIDFLVTVKSL